MIPLLSLYADGRLSPQKCKLSVNLSLKQMRRVYQVGISVMALCFHVDMELGVQVKLQQWPITPIAWLGLPTMLTLEVLIASLLYL